MYISRGVHFHARNRLATMLILTCNKEKRPIDRPTLCDLMHFAFMGEELGLTDGLAEGEVLGEKLGLTDGLAEGEAPSASLSASPSDSRSSRFE